ncbi:hypothetical protein [Phocaeicola sp.]|uniref:hypothetical protein n=1 Tax=Phocaeicola sp. TaxID=2773926 RepID=UPI00307BDA18
MKKDKNTKQQRVRVLQTGELGTVTDQVLMKRGNKPMVYKQVRLDSHPHLDRWYWADQLGAVRETCRITLTGGNGTELYINVTHDYEKYGSYEFEAFGKPANLKEHDRHGLPFLLTGALLKGLGVGQEGVETSVDVRPAISEKN